ncbi:MAG TPA: RNA-binding cell elongation regulator Jag/EloR [Spirochaetota bacterium]|jgi:spoIIIJ-associated protein|nr:RNA-binding cell elongation regulator Jag/EloR [Spirochaetota bacterium]HOR92662.1 RNA-binding cell elongation regulator Jag/EloR [Spirochaetota bacterium]HOT18619.1 RNA-binding cell elongation regulator Jag/EloR [Spirochaetota bacterium]HPD04230.1 RNA-binding cell elongation regulator Jag/EloR [Spirochaetota bacterium]HQG41123.1 RNA-binding cell elongation regulator Jag/EloR [Spirochaetota bacterium]
MKVLDIEGKTVEEATKKALLQLKIDDMNKINIEVLDEGKSGIFGFGISRPAKIRVYYQQQNDVGEKAKEIIEKIMSLMDVNATVKDFKESENKVYVELESLNSGLIIGKKGKTLEALQFMINLLVNKVTSSEKKIILDIESYRAKRERALRKLSKEIALKVARTGKPWTLEPMNPFERRLIHLTLQNDSKVTTKSEGQGIYRKVKIMPIEKGR